MPGREEKKEIMKVKLDSDIHVEFRPYKVVNVCQLKIYINHDKTRQFETSLLILRTWCEVSRDYQWSSNINSQSIVDSNKQFHRKDSQSK